MKNSIAALRILPLDGLDSGWHYAYYVCETDNLARRIPTVPSPRQAQQQISTEAYFRGSREPETAG